MKKNVLIGLTLVLTVLIAMAFADVYQGDKWTFARQAAPQVVIGTGTAIDTQITFDGNAEDFYIALDDSADDLIIGLGATAGTTPAISISDSGSSVLTTTVDNMIASYETGDSPNGDTTLTLADCGSTQFIGAAGDDFTLPTPTAGCIIDFVVDAAWATTAMTIITATSANILYGITTEAETDTNDDGPACAGNDTITLSESLETIGDWLQLRSNGTNWYVRGVAKLDGAFACSTAS